MKIQKVWFKNSKGQRLAGNLWTPKRYNYTLVFAAGIGWVSAEWETTPSWPAGFAKKGYRVLTFDFRGRGESEGDFSETTLTTNINDLNAAIDFLNSNVVLIGASFGGTASICIAAKNKRVKCLITMAAPHNLDAWLGGNRLAEAKKNGYSIGAESWQKYSLALFVNAREYKVIEKAKMIKVPWLIIHGNKDKSIPVQQARDFYREAKCTKELQIVKGADHGFNTDEADEVLFLLLRGWLKRYLK
ncbi:MAG TPA: alpha/beta fold hydrolase [Nanoarchaeota archaeon]|nr:alpha/beta fold hydrolase [Nanoarchaeota archaeon]